MSTLTIGSAAPDFSLATDAGTTFRLSDHRGHPVVLFFYPQDDTDNCTLENQEFSAAAKDFHGAGAVLAGVSPDTVETHCQFRDKYGLKALLIADPEHKAIEPYGVWRLKKLYGREYMGLVRTTFIIGADGAIAAIIPATRIKGHADRVLKTLRELTAA
jgi:thioredoxin-dependent peroxiredoxin